MTQILSLDDNEAVQDWLQLILESSGYQVQRTLNEDDAFSILCTQPVDLFIQDFLRPGLGGGEFLLKMKLDATLRCIPVLGLSGLTRKQVAVELEGLGLFLDRDLDGYLEKPCTPDTLLDTIQAILLRRFKPVPPQTMRYRMMRDIFPKLQRFQLLKT